MEAVCRRADERHFAKASDAGALQGAFDWLVKVRYLAGNL